MPIKPCFRLHIYFCLKPNFLLTWFFWAGYLAPLQVVLSLYFQTHSSVRMCPQKWPTAIWNRELAKSLIGLCDQIRTYVNTFDGFDFSLSPLFLIVKSDGNFYKLKNEKQNQSKPSLWLYVKALYIGFLLFTLPSVSWEKPNKPALVHRGLVFQQS